VDRPSIFGDGTAAQRIAEILGNGTVAFGLPRRPNEAYHFATAEVALVPDLR